MVAQEAVSAHHERSIQQGAFFRHAVEHVQRRKYIDGCHQQAGHVVLFHLQALRTAAQRPLQRAGYHRQEREDPTQHKGNVSDDG